MIDFKNCVVGTLVFWNDPDDGLYSGRACIVDVQPDLIEAEYGENTMVTISRHDGWEAERPVSELDLLPPQGNAKKTIKTIEGGAPKFLFINDTGTWAAVAGITSILEGGTPMVPEDHDSDDAGEEASYVCPVAPDTKEGELDLNEYDLPPEALQMIEDKDDDDEFDEEEEEDDE